MPAVILKCAASNGKEEELMEKMSPDKFIPSGQRCYQTTHIGPHLGTQRTLRDNVCALLLLCFSFVDI